MFKQVQLIVPVLVILALLGAACNIPTAAKAPVISNEDIAKTAAVMVISSQVVAPAAPVQVEEALATATPQPTATQCNPIATANTVANVRSGPGLGYDIIGSLPLGGSAPISGKDSSGTWWYIQFPSGIGGYAWIAGTVVTTNCSLPTLPMVAAPPLPTAAPATPTEVVSKPPLLVKPWLFLAIPSPTPTHLILLNPNLIKPVVPIVPIGP